MIAKRILYWTIPSLLCLALYWYGLKAWFQMDDFAWLSLHTLVHDFDSFVTTMLRPMAQGTIRPFSERLFFLGFWHLFGMDALPYRGLVFGTQFLNLVLITAITRRLTGSAAAGFIAPILWLVSPVLYVPMSWTSAYNQILCAFFLLLQFYLLLRFVDTGRKRYYAALWVVFLLGFGVLELNVVFPAIATAYLIFFGRRYLPYVAPMFVASIAFTVWHRSAGRGLASPTYAMDFHPATLLSTFAQYVYMSLGAATVAGTEVLTNFQARAAAVLVLLALLAFVGLMVWRRQWLAVFFVAWYVITLAPYLPLSNHISDYYLTVPVIGLAMLGGWACAIAWKAGSPARIAATAAVLLFAIPGVMQERFMTRSYLVDSRNVRRVVRGLAAAHRLHPKKVLVLTGVDNNLFWRGLYDRPEIAMGWSALYVASETERNIVSSDDRRGFAGRFLPEPVILEAIRTGDAAVYDVSQTPIRNVTKMYENVLAMERQMPLPHVIDPGSPLYAKYRKEGWFEQDRGYSWSGKRATVEMRGPLSRGGKLGLRALLTTFHTENGPMHVSAFVDGHSLGTREIPVGTTNCDLIYDLPDEVVGKPSILVTVDVDKTVVKPPDTRPVGLLFGTIEVTP